MSQRRDVLLAGEVPVDSEENVELGSRQTEELAVRLAGPPHLWSGPHVMAGQVVFEASREALVKQARTGRGAPPWSAPTPRYGLLPGDRREILQKLGQGLPCLKVIEELRERHARADEHGRAAHDLRIAVNDRLGLLHLGRALVAVSVKVSLSHPLPTSTADKRGDNASDLSCPPFKPLN